MFIKRPEINPTGLVPGMICNVWNCHAILTFRKLKWTKIGSKMVVINLRFHRHHNKKTPLSASLIQGREQNKMFLLMEKQLYVTAAALNPAVRFHLSSVSELSLQKKWAQLAREIHETDELSSALTEKQHHTPHLLRVSPSWERDPCCVALPDGFFHVFYPC